MLNFEVFPLDVLGASAERQSINLHLAYNLAVVLLSLPLIPPLTRFLDRILADPISPDAVRIERISALDETALDDPDRALICASREVLHIGEKVEAMLSPVLGLYETWDDATAKAIRENESEVNAMYFDTKLYLAKLHQKQIPEKTAHRSMELSSVAINLEAAGDVISKNLLGMAHKVHDKGLKFSPQGWRELCDFHDRVLSNVQLSLNVLMTKRGRCCPPAGRGKGNRARCRGGIATPPSGTPTQRHHRKHRNQQYPPGNLARAETNQYGGIDGGLFDPARHRRTAAQPSGRT